MKIYRALVEKKLNIGTIVCHVGERLFEDGDIYKPENGSYPISKIDVENKPTEYEFIEENERNADYYLKKLYTQNEVDDLNLWIKTMVQLPQDTHDYFFTDGEDIWLL